MRQFTVVLHYLDILTTGAPAGQAVYVVFVDADDCNSALKLAQLQAFKSLREQRVAQCLPEVTPACFALTVMFDGHHYPRMFGG